MIRSTVLLNMENEENVKSLLIGPLKEQDNTKVNIFLIPGFLSERKDSEHGPIIPNDEKSWARHFNVLTNQYQANYYVVNWPSAPLLAGFKELINNMILKRIITFPLPFGPIGFIGPIIKLSKYSTLLNLARSVWKEAIINSENAAKKLYRHLLLENKPHILIGHSLGGRIALRVCEMALSSAKPLHKTIALAPAIGQNELSWNTFNKCTHNDLEILYSKKDKVLKYLFPIGQGSLDKPVGLVGVPNDYRSNIASIDMTDRGYDSSRGHNDYEKDLPFLLQTSKIWTTTFSNHGHLS